MGNVFVGGKGVKMDANWDVKPFTYELTWFWYANDYKDRSKLDRVMFGRIQVGKNASIAGKKTQARASNATQKKGAWEVAVPRSASQKSSTPIVTVPSQFFRSMMEPDTAHKESKFGQEWKKAA